MSYYSMCRYFGFSWGYICCWVVCFCRLCRWVQSVLCVSRLLPVFFYFVGGGWLLPNRFSGWGVGLVYWPCRGPCLFDDILWRVDCAYCLLQLITFSIITHVWRLLVSAKCKVSVFFVVMLIRYLWRLSVCMSFSGG